MLTLMTIYLTNCIRITTTLFTARIPFQKTHKENHWNCTECHKSRRDSKPLAFFLYRRVWSVGRPTEVITDTLYFLDIQVQNYTISHV